MRDEHCVVLSIRSYWILGGDGGWVVVGTSMNVPVCLTMRPFRDIRVVASFWLLGMELWAFVCGLLCERNHRVLKLRRCSSGTESFGTIYIHNKLITVCSCSLFFVLLYGVTLYDHISVYPFFYQWTLGLFMVFDY